MDHKDSINNSLKIWMYLGIIYYDVGYCNKGSVRVISMWVVLAINHCWPSDVDYQIGIVELGNNRALQ